MSDIDRELVERFIDDDLRTAAVLKQGAGRMRQGAAEIARLQDRIESDAKVITALREALKPFAERGQSKSCLHNDLPGTFSGLSLREFRVARDTYEQIAGEKS